MPTAIFFLSLPLAIVPASIETMTTQITPTVGKIAIVEGVHCQK